MDTIDITDTVDLSGLHFNLEGDLIKNKNQLKETRIGLRPYNSGVIPVIYTELIKSNEKSITHNYGHGAAGWTLLFGSVIQSIKSFEESIISSCLDIEMIKSQETITILGMGCIGLTTALYLFEMGFKNLHIIAEEKDYLTSHIAGGSFRFPPGVEFKNEDLKSKVYQMMMSTYLVYTSILKGKHFLSHLDNVVTPIKLLSDDFHTGYEYMSDLKLIEKPRLVKVKYGPSKNPKLIELYEIDSFVINTDTYMKAAYAKLKTFENVKLELKKIISFSELQSRFVFNCTGLGSKLLNKDNSLYVGCGHGLVLMNQPNEKKFNYIITLKKVPGDFNENGSLYFMPKDGNYFLGGTNIKDYYGDDENLNREEFRKLVRRGQVFFNSTSAFPKF